METNTTLYEMIKKRIGQHEYKDYFSALCPYHSDKHPSMLVSLTGFRCLSCGEHGSLSRLYKTVFDLSYDYIDRKHSDKRTGTFAEIISDAETGEEMMRRGYGFDTLIDRGLTWKTIEKLHLGWLPNKKRCTIPIYYSEYPERDGEFQGLIYRNYRDDTGSKYHAYTTSHLYFPQYLNKYSDYVAVTFGIFDAIILWQLGYSAASTVYGKRMAKEAIEYLQSLNIRVYIIPDKDEEEDALKITRKQGLRWRTIEIDYPRGSKDVNDLYLNNYSLLIDSLSRYLGEPLENEV